MSIKHTLNASVVSDAGGAGVSGTSEEVGGTEITINSSFAASSTNAALAVAFNYADLQSIVITSTRNATIEFNNSTTGVPTIALIAGVPFLWRKSDGYFANPFTANVTTSYVTCTSATTIKMKILVT